jgi:hypothetical protein
MMASAGSAQDLSVLSRGATPSAHTGAGASEADSDLTADTATGVKKDQAEVGSGGGGGAVSGVSPAKGAAAMTALAVTKQEKRVVELSPRDLMSVLERDAMLCKLPALWRVYGDLGG